MAKKKEYIERGEVIKEIESLSVTVTGLRAGKNLLTRYAKHYKESVVRILTYARAADVVEVVRCKDCVDYKCDTPYCQKHRKGYCDRDGAIKQMEHYCAFGERNEATP